MRTMKKKLVALLLCLVMALSLIPTTVWAALDTGHSIDVRFTVLYVSDEFYLGYNTGSSEKTTFVCQYSTPHSDTAYSNHTIAISDIKAAAGRATVNEGYQIVGWAKKAKRNPTIWGLDVPGTTACNKGTTIYLVAKNPNPAPVPPDAPSTTYVENLNGLVNVYCTAESNELKNSGKLIAGTYDIGSVSGSAASGYTCTVTIQEAKVDDYMSRAGTGHEKDSEATQDREITLYYNATSKVWEKGNDLANLYAKCTPAPVEPSAPTAEELKDLTSLVKVHCTTVDSDHADQTYGLIDGSFTATTPVKRADGSYTSVVTIKNGADGVDKYVAKYNTDVAAGHVEDTGHDLTITVVWTNGTWGYGSDAADPATINVKCTPAPVEPSAPTWDDLETLLAGKVNMVCETNNSHNHTYGLLENTYNTSEVAKNANGVYTCTVTIINDSGVSEYIAKYNDDTNSKHEAGDTANDLTITLEYDKENSKWVVSATDNTAIIYVKCIPAPVEPSAPTWDDLETLLAGKVNMVCETNNSHNHTYGLLENTYNTSEVAKNANGVYTCTVTIINDSGVSEYIAKYNDDTNSKHEAGDTANDLTITLEYDKENSKWVVSATDNTAIIYVKCTSEQEAPEAPTAEDLENYKLVKVDCDTKSSHGEKLYPLLDGTFTTEVTFKDGIFQCVITITKDGAKEYVKQYGKDLGKTHSLKKLEDATITLTYKDNSWVVDENDSSASILAKCSTGNNSNPNPSKPSDGKPVTSSKTFDAGIALYAGLSILSLTGGALVIRKRKEF